MIYLITIHFVINLSILMMYLLSKDEKFEVLWKEVITTILIGWIVVFLLDED